MKKPTLSSAKKKAWKEFSKFIRLRDCLKTTETPEYGICVTCGKNCHFKELQAGHFIGGRTNSVLFVEDNCNAQCVGCNVFLMGNYDKYMIYMLDSVGEARVRELAGLKRSLLKYKISDYLELAEVYCAKYQELLNTSAR